MKVRSLFSSISSSKREAGQLTIYLEVIDNFRQVHPGNFKDMEKYADLLDIAIVNLKEANHFEELQDGWLYLKLQKSFLLQC